MKFSPYVRGCARSLPASRSKRFSRFNPLSTNFFILLSNSFVLIHSLQIHNLKSTKLYRFQQIFKTKELEILILILQDYIVPRVIYYYYRQYQKQKSNSSDYPNFSSRTRRDSIERGTVSSEREEERREDRPTGLSWPALDNGGRNKNRWLPSIPEWPTISNEPYGRQ